MQGLLLTSDPLVQSTIDLHDTAVSSTAIGYSSVSQIQMKRLSNLRPL